MGGRVYFVATTSQTGAELWTTDGTSAGTYLVRDIRPGAESSNIENMVTDGTRLYFGADDGEHGWELWTSDGTPDGTSMVMDMVPNRGSARPSYLAMMGGRVYFKAEGASVAPRLWVSDGTAAGTHMLLPPGGPDLTSPRDMTASGARVFFFTLEGLWVTDGTDAGTSFVRPLQLSVDNMPPILLTDVGGVVYFASGTDATGKELWRSDGTTAGTSMVVDLNPGPGHGVRAGQQFPAEFIAMGGELYFQGDDGVRGAQLWKTDGTPGGTVPVHVREISPGRGPYPVGLRVLGKQLVYLADDEAGGASLWGTYGTPGEAELLAPSVSNLRAFAGTAVVGADMFFSPDAPDQRAELWRTDGTPDNTVRVLDVPGINAAPRSLVALGSGVLYGAESPNQGRELWRSDGTPEGTAVVKDIARTATTNTAITPTGTDTVYFSAQSPSLGFELFKTRGTPETTSLVRDITPGPNSSELASFVYALDRLFFTRSVPSRPNRLWTSDGTTDGTREMGDAQEPGTLDMRGLGRLGDVVLFSTGDAQTGERLWRTDGTPEGTRLVVPVEQGSGPLLSSFSFKVFGGYAYFRATDPKHGTELWRTDGTAKGTTLFADLIPGSTGSGPSGLVPAGKQMFFQADNSLWVTDGTVKGTRRVQPAVQPVAIAGVTAFGDGVLFRARLAGGANLENFEPWYSDGTSEGTIQLGDLWPGTSGSGPDAFMECNGVGYFAANAPNLGRELFRTDGTPGGTAMIGDVVAGNGSLDPRTPVVFNGLMYFGRSGTGSQELWVSDGTGAGTLRLWGTGSSNSPIGSLTAGPDRLYLAAAPAGGEPHTSDGVTPDVLNLLRDIEPGNFNGSGAGQFVPAGSRVFFTASNAALGRELWSTDGTTAGTTPVDIYPGLQGSSPMNITPIGDGVVVFTATDPDQGRGGMYVSDGTPGGTMKIRARSTYLPTPQADAVVASGDLVYYTTAGSPGQLGRTDGTREGTRQLAAFTTMDSSGARSLARFGDVVLLSAAGVGVGEELWRSDGTPEGTAMVKDLIPGPDSGRPRNIVQVGERAFFAAKLATGCCNYELWVTDGTEAGTSLVLDIWPGPDAGNPREIVDLDGVAVFVAEDGAHGFEVWRSDGTAGGTYMVADVAPGAATSNPTSLRVANGQVFFSAGDGVSGRELWATDGTVGGTRRVRDIAPGALSSSPGQLVTSGANVYFTAYQAATGVELWQSDGIEGGTRRLFELVAGPGSADPTGLVEAGGRIYFMATPDNEQTSLWSFDWLAASRCPADLNLDGTVNSQDFFEYLVRFFGLVPEADYNGSGSVESQDFFDFLTDFFTAC
jgi:ELWxxDGT repeat protein